VAFDILPIDKQTLFDADALPGIDFEDNILIAAAVAASLDAIIFTGRHHHAEPCRFFSLPDSRLGSWRTVETIGSRRCAADCRYWSGCRSAVSPLSKSTSFPGASFAKASHCIKMTA
jgi:hypothetical protein